MMEIDVITAKMYFHSNFIMGSELYNAILKTIRDNPKDCEWENKYLDVPNEIKLKYQEHVNELVKKKSDSLYGKSNKLKKCDNDMSYESMMCLFDNYFKQINIDHKIKRYKDKVEKLLWKKYFKPYGL